MKPNIYIIAFFMATTVTYSQVGIGNETPRGMLDVNDNPNGNATMGLVLPYTNNPAQLQNPQTGEPSTVPGTFAFDRTNDCAKFIKNDSTWSDCISTTSSRSGSSGSSSRAGEGIFTPLRFQSIDQGASSSNFVIGLSVDGKVFAWGGFGSSGAYLAFGGGDPSRVDTSVRTPRRITNIPGDPVIIKAIRTSEAVMMLSEEGKVYALGNNPSNQFGSIRLTQGIPVEVTLPSGETEATDIAALPPIQVTFIVGESGKAYYSGRIVYPGFTNDNVTEYTEIPFPNGTDNLSPSFTYTKVFSIPTPAGGGGEGLKVFLEGNDGNYYAAGENTYGGLGDGITPTPNPESPSVPNPRTFVRVTSPPVRVNFPDGTKIEKFTLDDVNRATVALAEDGNAYFMGRLGSSGPTFNNKYQNAPIADSDTTRINSLVDNTRSRVTYYTSTPLLIAKPEGVSSFIDMEYHSTTRGQLFAVADNDSVYIHSMLSLSVSGTMLGSPTDVKTTDASASNTWQIKSDYLSTLNLQSLNTFHNRAFGLDKEGKAYFWGYGNRFPRGGGRGIAGTLAGHNENYLIPTELVDGMLDPENPAPR